MHTLKSLEQAWRGEGFEEAEARQRNRRRALETIRRHQSRMNAPRRGPLLARRFDYRPSTNRRAHAATAPLRPALHRSPLGRRCRVQRLAHRTPVHVIVASQPTEAASMREMAPSDKFEPFPLWSPPNTALRLFLANISVKQSDGQGRATSGDHFIPKWGQFTIPPVPVTGCSASSGFWAISSRRDWPMRVRRAVGASSLRPAVAPSTNSLATRSLWLTLSPGRTPPFAL